MRDCTICMLEKDSDSFYGNRNVCKDCNRKLYSDKVKDGYYIKELQKIVLYVVRLKSLMNLELTNHTAKNVKTKKHTIVEKIHNIKIIKNI